MSVEIEIPLLSNQLYAILISAAARDSFLFNFRFAGVSFVKKLIRIPPPARLLGVKRLCFELL